MTVRRWVDQNLDGVLVADGHDHAIIGHAYTPGRGQYLVYSASEIIAGLMQQGMSEEEAEEYFAFNIEGAYAGEGTPVFMWAIPEEHEE